MLEQKIEKLCATYPEVQVRLQNSKHPDSKELPFIMAITLDKKVTCGVGKKPLEALERALRNFARITPPRIVSAH